MPDALRDWGRRVLPPVPPLSRRAMWWLVAIVAAGAVLRLAWATQAEEPVALRDPSLYLVLADHVAAGDGYTYGDGPDQGQTAYYPPGYPVALGAVIWLVRLVPGDWSAFGVAVGMNVVLSVATIGLVFALARRLAGNAVGLVAAGIWALWPNLVFHSAIVLTETLFLFLFVLLLLVALADPAVARAPGTRRLVAIGVLFGACALVRPVSLVAAPAFLVLWWGPAVRTVLWRGALAGLAAVAVMVPWAVRSTLVMDEPVALSLNLGDNLCLGHNPGASGGFGDLGEHCFTAEGLQRPESETRRQSENVDRALRYIRDEPGTTLRRTVTKARITLEDDADGLDVAEDFGARRIVSGGTRDTLELAANAFYAVVAVAGIAGAVILVRRTDPGRRGLFLVVVGLAQLATPLATFGDPRFKMPLYPTLAVGAAVALVAAADRLRSRRAAGDGGSAPGEDRGVPARAAT
ncbi:MAG TPA: glycosyltransferase family 39 protein [Acidimicrobiales bacterium]|nr:glycosyltransferase family 39 protein [Acidimicrobiales bacterium]